MRFQASWVIWPDRVGQKASSSCLTGRRSAGTSSCEGWNLGLRVFTGLVGGGGSGITSVNATTSGSTAAVAFAYFNAISATAAATSGAAIINGDGMFGGLGGGGGASNGTPTRNGGNASRGSGGGGGAASVTGTTSGAGGNGGDGYVVVVCV